MKKWIITVLLAIATALSSLAKEKAYFKEISTLPAVNYTYISPSMLSSMGDRSINTKAFSISATQLHSVEIVQTFGAEQSAQKALETVKKVIKKEKLQTLATKSAPDGSTMTIMGKPGKEKNTVTQLLHIESLKGGSTAVTYITGNITLNYSDFNY